VADPNPGVNHLGTVSDSNIQLSGKYFFHIPIPEIIPFLIPVNYWPPPVRIQFSLPLGQTTVSLPVPLGTPAANPLLSIDLQSMKI
jgi:hypothetical protein